MTIISKIIGYLKYRFKRIFNYHLFRQRILKFKLKSFGEGSTIKFPVHFEVMDKIEIGRFVSINPLVHIWGTGGVFIGDRVMIASHTAITSATHNTEGTSMRFGELILKPVIIEDDVWIGAHTVIMPGVRIGKGAVVGAGSVVTKDVEENTVVIGVPAKFVRKRLGTEKWK